MGSYENVEVGLKKDRVALLSEFLSRSFFWAMRTIFYINHERGPYIGPNRNRQELLSVGMTPAPERL
jgi:hypothetical protein